MINKRQRKPIQQNRMRSQSQDLCFNSDFQQQMKCNQTLEELNYFPNNFRQDQQNYDECTCTCTKCQGYIKAIQNQQLDPEEKKRLKRRQYKKRQKLKIQQKKQQALKNLSAIIVDIYSLKTDSKKEKNKIQQYLRTIQRNQNRFYQFINSVIRQQVEAIKKQMRICLSQIASESPNFSKVPRLYEQFMRVKDASPEVQFIINFFIKIISQKNQEAPRYHKDLGKKTFKFLLISDAQNRNNFLKVIKIIQEGNIKYERQKQMLRMMVEMIKQKHLSSECSSSEDDSERDYSQNDEFDYESQDYTIAQNKTKSSQHQQQNDFDEDGNCEEGQQKQNSRQNQQKKGLKRRKKAKVLKMYEASYQKTYEALQQLQKTQGLNEQIQRLPCNLEEEWMNKFRQKFLKKTKSKVGKTSQIDAD